MNTSNLLIGICSVSVLVTLFFLLRTVRCTRRGRLLRASGAAFGTIISAVIATASLLLAVSYFSYQRLTSEQLITTVEFRQTSPGEFQARLMFAGEHDQLFILRGDEWQMDARLVTWKPPVTILGLDLIYRLERLSGRYTDIVRERQEARTVHALSEPQMVDIWQLARRFPALTPGIDAYYGSATYVPMADGARFAVYLSRDALLARPVNAAAQRAVGDWQNL